MRLKEKIREKLKKARKLIMEEITKSSSWLSLLTSYYHLEEQWKEDKKAELLKTGIQYWDNTSLVLGDSIY